MSAAPQWVETPDSSTLARFRYDAPAQVLEVQFKSGAGGTWRYFSVLPEVYGEFLAAKSKGSFFMRRIRPVYRCERVQEGQ